MEDPSVVDVILEWSYKPKRPEEMGNNGLLLLADLYSMASINLRGHVRIFGYVRFGMRWVVGLIKRNLIRICCCGSLRR